MRFLLTPRRRKIARMASSGIAHPQIAILLGIKLSTLKLFFPRELELGAAIAAIRFRSNATAKPTKPEPQPKKSIYMSEGPPPGTLIICGPNGQEISN